MLNTITYEKHIDDILKLILMAATNGPHIKICSIWLVDREENPQEISLKASQVIETDRIKHRVLSLNEGVVGLVATHKQTLVIDDVLTDMNFKEKEMAWEFGLVSMLGLPMIDKNGEIVGVLNCFTTKPHRFCETEVNLMGNIANQAANVISNAELMGRARLIQEELDTRVFKDSAIIKSTRSESTGHSQTS